MRWAITAVLFWNPSLDAARSYCMLAGNDVELQTARGEVMGDLLTRAECAAVRKAAGPRLVCAKYSGEWFLTDSDALKKIGRALALSDCTALSEGSGVELYCTQASGMGTRSWYPTHLTTGERFGRFGTELADCLVLTKNSSPGVVCTNTGTYNFGGRKPTRVDERPYSDANLMGASGQQAYCVKSTANARNGFVCACNGDYCAERDWIRYDVKRKQTVGGTVPLDTCIAAQ